MLLEMYEQTVRNQKEGAMAKYFSREIMINEEFIFGRIGEDGRAIRNYFLSVMKNKPQAGEHGRPKNVFGLKTRLKNYLLRRWNIDLHAHEIGKFRLEGEIHQWMYDRYSLSNLLRSKNAGNIQVKNAFTSNIADWSKYELDGIGDVARKPDSLFIEAVKK